MIKLTVDFRDAKKFNNLIRYIQNNLLYGEVQERVKVLGHHAADHMRSTINSERKRPTKASHKLDNAITAETLSTVGGIEVGIGRISKLNAQAPYWEMIDAGANYTTKIKHIVPFEDGEFRTFKVGSSHIIEGISFVQKAILNLDKELRVMMKKWGSEFIKGAGK